MKKLINMVIGILKKPQEVPLSKPKKHNHTITVDIDLNRAFAPKPKKMIPQKEIYNHSEVRGIGANVQFRREDLKLTQMQLSELLGYKSTSFVSRLELWELEKIKHEQVENLAKCLDTSVEELLFARHWY